MELQTIFGMGKYGAYVWSCVALSVIVLVGNGWLARRALAQELVRARRRIAAGRES